MLLANKRLEEQHKLEQKQRDAAKIAKLKADQAEMDRKRAAAAAAAAPRPAAAARPPPPGSWAGKL